jgi:transcriptional regulator with XRE-family HTH domain
MISTAAPFHERDAATVATNVRRLMAREGLTFQDIVEATGLDERTLRGLVRGTNNPHARTLHKLAHGLGVAVDELFQPAAATRQAFDRATNPLIETVVRDHADVFQGWSEAEFGELASQFGTGGPLTEAGVLAAAEAINAKHALLQQVCVILESSESELLSEFVRLLYQRIRVTASQDSP